MELVGFRGTACTTPPADDSPMSARTPGTIVSFAPCVTLDDVVARLAELEQVHLARRDRRAVFLTVYGYMSREMKQRIEERTFADNEWVERYTVAFANLYLEALQAYDRAQDRAEIVDPRVQHGESGVRARIAGSVVGHQRSREPRPCSGVGSGFDRPGPGWRAMAITRR